MTAEELELVMEQHARIATSIEPRNPDEAGKAMKAHLQWAQKIETDRAEAFANTEAGVSASHA